MKVTAEMAANEPYVEKSGTKATIWISTAHAGSVARHIINGHYRTHHKWILQDTKTYSQEAELARLRPYHGMENMGQYVHAEFTENHYRCENCGETGTETECDQDINPEFM